MSQDFYAAKDLVIDGKPIRKGQPVPEKIDPERLRNGLHIGAITARAPAVKAAPPAPQAAPAAPIAPAPVLPLPTDTQAGAKPARKGK